MFHAKGTMERTLTEITVKLKKTEEQAVRNTDTLEEIRKKQTELEHSSLRREDIKALSDEVISRLRLQLRMESSRYSKR